MLIWQVNGVTEFTGGLGFKSLYVGLFVPLGIWAIVFLIAYSMIDNAELTAKEKIWYLTNCE